MDTPWCRPRARVTALQLAAVSEGIRSLEASRNAHLWGKVKRLKSYKIVTGFERYNTNWYHINTIRPYNTIRPLIRLPRWSTCRLRAWELMYELKIGLSPTGSDAGRWPRSASFCRWQSGALSWQHQGTHFFFQRHLFFLIFICPKLFLKSAAIAQGTRAVRRFRSLAEAFLTLCARCFEKIFWENGHHWTSLDTSGILNPDANIRTRTRFCCFGNTELVQRTSKIQQTTLLRPSLDSTCCSRKCCGRKSLNLFLPIENRCAAAAENFSGLDASTVEFLFRWSCPKPRKSKAYSILDNVSLVSEYPGIDLSQLHLLGSKSLRNVSWSQDLDCRGDVWKLPVSDRSRNRKLQGGAGESARAVGTTLGEGGEAHSNWWLLMSLYAVSFCLCCPGMPRSWSLVPGLVSRSGKRLNAASCHLRWQARSPDSNGRKTMFEMSDFEHVVRCSWKSTRTLTHRNVMLLL